MPEIRLKPNSAEYFDDEETVIKHTCDMPGCSESGVHKAPKDRSLADYYIFCLSHVQEYNRAWDFFSGMANKEVEDHILRSYFGDRPTWNFSDFSAAEEAIMSKTRAYYGEEEAERLHDQKKEQHYTGSYQNTPEFESMAIMGLTPPLTLDKIKSRYKELAKKYHPDLNREDPDAEEHLKRINMAYTILKLGYEQFKTIED